MNIKQLSVFVENKFGRAFAIIDTLSENGINISALSIADTSEYGIMRLIVDNPEKAKELLIDSGVMVKITNVIAIPMGNTPGALSGLLKVLTENRISVEYMYAFTDGKDGGAMLVIKTDDNEKADKVLSENKI